MFLLFAALKDFVLSVSTLFLAKEERRLGKSDYVLVAPLRAQFIKKQDQYRPVPRLL